jgi:hypothetical protein
MGFGPGQQYDIMNAAPISAGLPRSSQSSFG